MKSFDWAVGLFEGEGCHPYHHRNRLIAEYCDELVAFWDGSSTGTKYTIDYARRIGRPVHVFKYK